MASRITKTRASFAGAALFVAFLPLRAHAQEPPSSSPPLEPLPSEPARTPEATTPGTPAPPAAPPPSPNPPAVLAPGSGAHEMVYTPPIGYGAQGTPARYEPTPIASAPPKSEGPPRFDYLRIGAGLRVGYVATHGFDRFASNDTLLQFSLEATYAFWTSRNLALAIGAAYDVGGRSSDLRGLETNLTVHRLTVPIEGRYHATRGIYGFLRAAPGAAAFVTEIKDPSANGSLTQTPWVFALDASLGASVLLGPHKSFDKRSVHVWITPEVGYAFTTSADLRPKPDRAASDAVGTDASSNFGSLATSGFFWRASLAMTF